MNINEEAAGEEMRQPRKRARIVRETLRREEIRRLVEDAGESGRGVDLIQQTLQIQTPQSQKRLGTARSTPNFAVNGGR